MSETTAPLTSEEKIASSKTIGNVRIFIRSPTISLPDGFSIYATPKTSMLALKKAISENHPLKPQVKEQRLIYRGRVLDNSEIVSEVLKDDLSTDQTFHLVVKPSFETGAENHSSSATQTVRPSFTWLRRRGNANATTNSSPNTLSNGQPPQTQMPVDPPQSFGIDTSSLPTYLPLQNAELALQQWTQQQQNILWQQQNALRSYQNPSNPQQPSQSSQFNNSHPVAINQQAFPFGYPFPYYVMINGLPYMMPAPYIPQPPYPYPPLHHNLQQIVQPQLPFPPQQPEVHEGGRNRRRATTFWLLLKLGFLVYLFSQNASIERIILLNIFALVIFLYETGRLRIVRRRRHRGGHHGHNNIFVPQAPQIAPAIVNNQANPPPLGRPNAAVAPDTPSSSPTTQASQASSSGQTNLPQAQNTNGVASSSNNENPPAIAGEAPVPEAVIRQITLRNIEHGLYAFVASLIPTNVPDAVQQDDNVAL